MYLPIQLGRSSKHLFTLLQIKLIISHSVLIVMERTDCSPHCNCYSFKDKTYVPIQSSLYRTEHTQPLSLLKLFALQAPYSSVALLCNIFQDG